jgi:hypothetical protein
MSTPATVPIIGPDGNTYDIPHDQVSNAVSQGGKLAMDIVGPDKQTYAVPLDNVHAALAQGGMLKPPPMPAAPRPQALQPTPTLQQAAAIKDPTLRGQAIAQRFSEDVRPIAESAQAAVPAMPVSEAISALPKAAKILPSAEEAGKVFDQLIDDIGDHPVEITDRLSNAISQAQDWATRGGQKIKQVTDFVKRVTDPDLPDLTWSEARDFYSNLTSRLSPDQASKLSPKAYRHIGRVADALDDTLAQTADDAGKLSDYRGAMDEYKSAMGLEDIAELAKKAAKQTGIQVLKWAIPGAATAYALKQIVSNK